MKATSLKVLEQRAAMEDDARMSQVCETSSSPEQENWLVTMPLKEEMFMENKMETEKESEVSSRLQQGGAKESLPQLQVPKYNNMEWMQDPFLLRSPWLENWTSYTNVLNF